MTPVKTQNRGYYINAILPIVACLHHAESVVAPGRKKWRLPGILVNSDDPSFHFDYEGGIWARPLFYVFIGGFTTL